MYSFMTAMLLAYCQHDRRHYALPSKFDSRQEVRRDLPCWDIDGATIYAKDEKTAIKYAKKRGLWRSGAIVKRIQK